MKLPSACLLISAMLLAGCGTSVGTQDALAGRWSGDPVLGNVQAERLLKDKLHIDLELMPEQRFQMTMLQTPMGGTWGHSGSEVTLTIETLEGKTFAEYESESPAPKPKLRTEGLKKPWTLDVEPDGTLKKLPESAAEPEIVFRKVP